MKAGTAMEGVAVQFKVECSCTQMGESVYVVGSSPSIGGWKPELGLACATAAQAFPVWTSEKVVLPASSKLEFKIIRQKPAAPSSAVWAPGENLVVQLPPGSTSGTVLVSCAWGKSDISLNPKGAKQQAATIGGATEREVALKPDAPEKDGSRSRSLSGGPRMRRMTSRHILMDDTGAVNVEMSRTPSFCLFDMEQLLQDAEKCEKEMATDSERKRLDKLQRRLPSGTLLEEMAKITQEVDPSKQVLLQGFNWESWRAGGGDWYGLIGRNVDMFADLGVTDIWLPPCSQSVAPQGYLPSQLFNLNGSKYGNQAALQDLLEKMHEVGIRGVADIVINHRCADMKDSEGRWNVFSAGLQERQDSFSGIMDWGGWAITLGDKYSDGTGLNHPGAFDGKFDAAPDIDHANEGVQKSISVWLRWLRLTIGFDAWRFDFAKGYGAEYVGKYCKKSEPAWAVGELWCDMEYDDEGLKHDQDKHRQDLVNWINATGKASTAFDFTTKGVLQEALRKTEYSRLKDRRGKPPGLIGWMPTHAVTFIDNHDTGSTQRHWPFPDDKVMVGYAYILTHPGIPSLFWDHVMDWGIDFRKRIGELIQARRDADIKVDSPVKIMTAERELYVAEIGNPPTLRVALGPRSGGEKAGSDYWSGGPAGNHYRVWIHKRHLDGFGCEIAAPPTEPKKTAPPASSPPAVAAPASSKVSSTVQAIEQSVDLAGLRKASAQATPKSASISAAPAAAADVKPVAQPAAPASEVKQVAATIQPLVSTSKNNFQPVVIDGVEISRAFLQSTEFTGDARKRILERLDAVRHAVEKQPPSKSGFLRDLLA